MLEIKLFEQFCRCDWRCARWRRAVRRAGAFEVFENLADQLRVLNTGDDLQRPAAVLAGLDVDVEDALQALRPTHGHVPRGCPRLFLRRAVCATELGRHDPRSQAMSLFHLEDISACEPRWLCGRSTYDPDD
jgi:hypothetical protein